MLDAGSLERVHIVTVPPPGSSPTELLERFSTVLGVDAARLNASPTVVNTNPSLGHVQAQLLRQVNEVMGADLLEVGSPTARGQNYLDKHVLADQRGARRRSQPSCTAGALTCPSGSSPSSVSAVMTSSAT